MRTPRSAGSRPAGPALRTPRSLGRRQVIGRIRSSIGNGFTLWDGSSRHIEASLAAGASGVVATPLALLPEPFPGRSTEKVQAAVKRLYTQVDRAASREDRMNLLTSLFRHAA